MPRRKVSADAAVYATEPTPTSKTSFGLTPTKTNFEDGLAQTPTKSDSSVVKERHVVIGDMHLRRTDPLGVVEKDGLNTRLKDKLAALQYCVDYAVANAATHIDMLGDIYEAMNPPERLKELFWQTLRPAMEKQVQITILIGNHDTTGDLYNFAGDTVIAPSNIKIVKSSWYNPNNRILYLAYAHKDEILNTYAKNAAEARPFAVFGHFEIEGAELASDNSKIREGIDRNTFSDVPVVWLGHIHKHQVFRPGFAYIGSCVKCDFGEVNNTKVVGVMDILQNGGCKLSYAKIPQRPMYQISVAENDPHNLYLSKTIPDVCKEEGILLKLVLTGSEEWVSAIDKAAFKKRFPNAIRILIEDRKQNSDREKTEIVTTAIIDRVHEYVQTKGKGKEYLDAGIELAKAAQEIDL